MKILPRMLPLAVLALVGGCVRTNTDTVVTEDGSWTRTVKYTIQKEDMMGKPNTFDQFIALPTGTEWKTSQATEKENLVFTAVRQAKLGDTITNDLQIKQKGKPILANTVTVRDLGNGRYEYLETIQYVGEAKPDLPSPEGELMAMLRESLVGIEVTDAQIKEMSQAAMIDLWRIIFGPTRPMLPSLILHPDLGERELRRSFGRTMDVQFEKFFGDKMDKDARLKAIRSLMAKMDAEKVMGPTKEKAQSESSSGEGDQGFVSMSTIVKLPGRIVEANGEIDEVSGEVFWAFFSESPQMAPLTLRAVCEVKK